MCSLALALRKRYAVHDALTDEAVARILASEGLTVVENVPFPGEGLVELVALGHLYLKAGLSRRWRRWLMPHGLAHHLCDSPGQVYLYTDESAVLSQQERRAELTAGWLHFWAYVQAAPELDPVAMAEWADVPCKAVRRWLTLAEHQIRELRQPSVHVVD